MPMNAKVAELVLDGMGLSSRDAREIRERLDEVAPDHGLEDAEILVLWNDFSDRDCCSWRSVGREAVERFARSYGIEPGGSAPAFR